MSYVKQLIKRNISTITELETVLSGNYQKYRYGPNVINNDMDSIRILFIVTTETLLMYRHLYFDCEKSGVWQNLIKVLIHKLTETETGHLDVYCEHLRKKLDKDYRLVARKKYIFFFFKGLFGIDIATMITEHMEWTNKKKVNGHTSVLLLTNERHNEFR